MRPDPSTGGHRVARLTIVYLSVEISLVGLLTLLWFLLTSSKLDAIVEPIAIGGSVIFGCASIGFASVLAATSRWMPAVLNRIGPLGAALAAVFGMPLVVVGGFFFTNLCDDPTPCKSEVLLMTPGAGLAGILVGCILVTFVWTRWRRLAALIAVGIAATIDAAAQTDFPARLVAAAVEQTRYAVRYDGSYRRISYPNGDVPADVGVCTDVVIRAYRRVGIDLQERVHEDMRAAFDAYPKHWGLTRPDPNIDHRRVPNLQVFFRRHGVELPVSRDGDEYRPGEVVTWMLPGNLPHIGIVTSERTLLSRRPLIVHNIGRGPEIEDVLFDYPITGHYRYGTSP